MSGNHDYSDEKLWRFFTWLAVGMDHKTMGVVRGVGSHVPHVTSTSVHKFGRAFDAKLNGEEAPQRA